jgi:hypothetical protein
LHRLNENTYKKRVRYPVRYERVITPLTCTSRVHDLGGTWNVTGGSRAPLQRLRVKRAHA